MHKSDEVFYVAKYRNKHNDYADLWDIGSTYPTPTHPKVSRFATLAEAERAIRGFEKDFHIAMVKASFCALVIS